MKRKIPLKVKRNPADKTWRYSFRNYTGGQQQIDTGDAGPAYFTEAQAFRRAFVQVYGDEPFDEDYPEGVLEAHNNGGVDANYDSIGEYIDPNQKAEDYDDMGEEEELRYYMQYGDDDEGIVDDPFPDDDDDTGPRFSKW